MLSSTCTPIRVDDAVKDGPTHLCDAVGHVFLVGDPVDDGRARRHEEELAAFWDERYRRLEEVEHAEHLAQVDGEPSQHDSVEERRETHVRTPVLLEVVGRDRVDTCRHDRLLHYGRIRDDEVKSVDPMFALQLLDTLTHHNRRCRPYGEAGLTSFASPVDASILSTIALVPSAVLILGHDDGVRTARMTVWSGRRA